METIYVSIASYMDLELTNTVYSLLSQAKDTSRLFLSIFSQDEDTQHPKLEYLFKLFNLENFEYTKINYKDALGVGYARHMAQKSLSNSHDYYLQVDSHTQFIENWDQIVIDDYNSAEAYWGGKIIFTSYPGTYEYTKFGNIRITDIETPTSLRVQTNDGVTRFEPKYNTYDGDENGKYNGYFCAGFAFGRSLYFLNTPYDKNIYFNGEEQTLSIRFFCDDVKLIAPNKNYAFHHYNGTRRSRHWEKTPNWEKHDRDGVDRLERFFNLDYLEGYGIKNAQKYELWKQCFITPRED